MTSVEQELAKLRREVHRLAELVKALDPDRSMTIREFCSWAGMSETQYHEQDHRPDVYFIGEPGALRKSPRISGPSRRKWREEREQMAREYQAAIAAE